MSDRGIKVLADKISENIKRSILDDLLNSNANQTSFNNEETPIGIEECSKLIGKAKQTIYGLVCRKEIPYHKGGKKLYFFKSQILEWIKNPESFKQSPKEKLEIYLQNSAKQLKSKRHEK